MVLTEEDKSRIEEEEKYRAQVRGDLKEEKPPKKASVGKGCLTLILILIIGFVIISLLSTPKSKNTSTENSVPTQSPAQIEQEKGAEEMKIKNLSNSICEKRSDGMPYLNLESISKMIDGQWKEGELIYNTTTKPLPDICDKIAGFCLKTWGETECQGIAEKKIWIDMSQFQLELAMGNPRDKNNTTGTWGIHSQWVYGDFGPYIYLEGEDKDSMKVTSWQD